MAKKNKLLCLICSEPCSKKGQFERICKACLRDNDNQMLEAMLAMPPQPEESHDRRCLFYSNGVCSCIEVPTLPTSTFIAEVL